MRILYSNLNLEKPYAPLGPRVALNLVFTYPYTPLVLHPNTLSLCTSILHKPPPPPTSKAINLPQYRGKGKYLEKD